MRERETGVAQRELVPVARRCPPAHGALEEGVQRGPPTFSTGEPDPTGVHPDPDIRKSRITTGTGSGARPRGQRTVINGGLVSGGQVRLPRHTRPESVREACPRTKSTHLIYRSFSLPSLPIDPQPRSPPLHPHLPVHDHLLSASRFPSPRPLFPTPSTASPSSRAPPALASSRPLYHTPFPSRVPRPAPRDHTHSQRSALVSGPESRPCRHTPRRPRPGAHVREVGHTPPSRVAVGGGSDTSRVPSPGCASRRGRARLTRSGRCAPSRHTPRRPRPGARVREVCRRAPEVAPVPVCHRTGAERPAPDRMRPGRNI